MNVAFNLLEYISYNEVDSAFDFSETATLFSKVDTSFKISTNDVLAVQGFHILTNPGCLFYNHHTSGHTVVSYFDVYPMPRGPFEFFMRIFC